MHLKQIASSETATIRADTPKINTPKGISYTG